MTSIYLHPDHIGKGIGEVVYSSLIEELKKVDEVHRAYGLVVLPNPGSEKLHEKLGFQVAGLPYEGGYKFGKYHDVRECMSTGWEISHSPLNFNPDSLSSVIMERIHRRAPPAHNH